MLPHILILLWYRSTYPTSGRLTQGVPVFWYCRCVEDWEVRDHPEYEPHESRLMKEDGPTELICGYEPVAVERGYEPEWPEWVTHMSVTLVD